MPRSTKYPWLRWTNGEVWSVDFPNTPVEPGKTSDVAKFRSLLATHATTKGLRVRTSKVAVSDPGQAPHAVRVIFQFGPADAPPSHWAPVLGPDRHHGPSFVAEAATSTCGQHGRPEPCPVCTGDEAQEAPVPAKSLTALEDMCEHCASTQHASDECPTLEPAS